MRTGTGKTTTMRAVAGLIGRRGTVSVGGAALRPGDPGAAAGLAAGLRDSDTVRRAYLGY